MRRLLFVIAILFVVYQMASLPAVYGQTKKDEITAEEKKAANELADHFIQRLDETGDIEPLIKEMFVSDFAARYVKEQKTKQSDPTFKSKTIFYAPGLEYDSTLLDQANEDDWRQFYSLTFDFMQYGISVTMNKMAKSLIDGVEPKEPDSSDMDELAAEMYPKTVIKLFDSHPILKNFIIMKGRTPIRTVGDMRSVNRTLRDGISLLQKDNAANRMKMTPDAKKVQQVFREKSGTEFGPWLAVSDSESYGFPKKTRFITFFASPWHQLMIVKVAGEYKIVYAKISSPD